MAVGKEIRWADLVYMKEAYEEKEKNKNAFVNGKLRDSIALQYEENHAQGYRVCSSESPFSRQNADCFRPSRLKLQMTLGSSSSLP